MTRFFEGYPWQFLFTDLDCVTTAFASPGLTTNRKFVKTLGQPSVIDCDVDPTNPLVNIISSDGYPRVAPSKRLLFGFRREAPAGTSSDPWVCRAAGICMTVEDEGEMDVSLSHITAYDPRKLLEARPIQFFDGALPDPQLGLQFFQSAGSIALELLHNTIENDGNAFIDAGVAYGGTAFWGGVIESTPEINMTFQRGGMVADAWNQIEETQSAEFVLTPIYDPVNRPGYTHELSVYRYAGSEKRNAVFAWDELNHSLTTISRVHDGTPGSFFNTVQYYAGLGGFPVPPTPLVNNASVTDFGVYWAQQFFPSLANNDPLGVTVFALAQQALRLAKQGKRTLTLNPIPERGPIPLDHYDIGDRVPVHASANLRVTSDGLQRVEAMPFDISDDGIEHIAGLLVSPDWELPEPTPAQQTITTTITSIQPQTHRPITRSIRIHP